MPPKAKYTREEIVQKAFQMTREKGIEAVAARELGKRLGTSSSPIFTAFKNMEELFAFLNLKPHIENQVKQLICIKPKEGRLKIERYTERRVDF